MEIKVRTKEQQAIDNLKAIVNSKDKIIEIEPPIEDTAQILLDYITNLQEENKEWSMIFDTFSKRPYAHKYLEEKKKELGNKKIIGLDSEMIYKDYYDCKSRIDKARGMIRFIAYNSERPLTITELNKVYNILGGDDNAINSK